MWYSSLISEPTRSTLSVDNPATTFLRGEDNLRGWRPRRESLIWDHQEQLYTLETLEEVRVCTCDTVRVHVGCTCACCPTSACWPKGLNYWKILPILPISTFFQP